MRDFLAQWRAAAQATPEDIAPAGRIYFYYRRSGNMAAARRALMEYRMRKKTPWKGVELRTLARLFEDSKDYVEAARAWKSLSELPNDPAAAEDGLAGLWSSLLSGSVCLRVFPRDRLLWLWRRFRLVRRLRFFRLPLLFLLFLLLFVLLSDRAHGSITWLGSGRATAGAWL